MDQKKLELEVERLLLSCAIFPRLKGFYPLRDLVLLYYNKQVPAGQPREAAAYLVPLYGPRCRAAMARALRCSWRRPECRLTGLMGLGPLDAPPAIDAFALALCRRLEAPA